MRTPASEVTWLDTNWRAVALVFTGVVTGLALGWWIGSWTACGADCEPKISAMEALGTWVGGLGTVGAVGFAVVAFRAEERARRAADDLRRSTERREREDADESMRKEQAGQDAEARRLFQRDAKLAELITIHCQIGGNNGHCIDELRFVARNDTIEAPIFKVKALHAELGELGVEHTLQPDEEATWRFRGSAMTMRKVVAPLANQELAWTQAEADKVTLTFTLGGRRWRRRGSGPVAVMDESAT